MCSVQFNREDGSGSGFGSWKTVLAVPVPRSVPGETVPTVLVSSSGSVPGPPCLGTQPHDSGAIVSKTALNKRERKKR